MSTGAMTQKTHPMVLVAAVALTIFSLLGSAAIAGLIPIAHPEKKDVVLIPAPSSGTETIISNGKNLDKNNKGDGYISKVQPAPGISKNNACIDCGMIVSIQPFKPDSEAAGTVAGGITGNLSDSAYAGHNLEKNMKASTVYVIKVRMDSGRTRTITQYSEPQHSVGDQVRLKRGLLTSA